MPDVFKTVVWDMVIKAAIADALGILKLSVSGPVGIIITMFATALGDWFYKKLIKVVKVEAIPLLNAANQKSFEISQVKLKVVAYESGIDSLAFKDAHKNEQEKFFKAIRFISDPLVLRDD